MNQSSRQLLILFLCISLIAAACGPTTDQEPPPGTVLRIVSADGETTFVTQADIDGLSQVTINVEGRDESGPSLLDVLALGGITSFNTLTLTGNGSITLDFEQINPKVILDQTNRGTVKLAAEGVPKRDWVKDITLIEVK